MKITITIENDNGKTKVLEEEFDVEEYIEEADKTTPHVSDYARFFDESCWAWRKDSEYNLMFLRTQQQYATDKLRAQGCLFLNEVYDMLGMPRTKAGQVVGWVYDLNNPNVDNCVDFGIYDGHNKNFVNGYETIVLLDFNVDGTILDYLPEEKES